MPGANSGVTVGTGVDLGQRDADDIRVLDIPPELAEKLVPYAGHKGEAADKFLEENPLTLTKAEAEALDAAVWKDIVGKVERRYNRATEKNGSDVRFADLPDEVPSSIVNIAYVSGDNLEIETPKFWGDVTSQYVGGFRTQGFHVGRSIDRVSRRRLRSTGARRLPNSRISSLQRKGTISAPRMRAID